jgi:hypothetical protein
MPIVVISTERQLALSGPGNGNGKETILALKWAIDGYLKMRLSHVE